MKFSKEFVEGLSEIFFEEDEEDDALTGLEKDLYKL
jgi:hypothetical protein